MAAAALAGGLLAATRLNMEMMPDMDFPIVTVVTAYPGASPEDVVERVTKPVEQAVATASGLKEVRSTSASGVSIVIAEFEFGTNTKEAEAAMQSALSKLSFPENVQAPRAARVDLNDLPVVQISLTGQTSPSELRRIASETLVPELSRAEGVYSVELLGGEEREVSVVLDPKKAADRGISYQQVATLLEANSLALPAGSVDVGGVLIPVRTFHEFQSIDEVRETVVGMDRGAASPLPAAGLAATPASGAAPGGQPGQASPGAVEYTVQPGDTLTALAARFGSSVRAIAAANRLSNPDLIFPEQRLVVPRSAAPTVGQAGSSGMSAPGPASAQPSQPQPVKLGEIASVSDEPAAAAGLSRTNGKPSVLLMVRKSQDANTVRVAKAVVSRLEALKGQLGAGVETVIVADESRYVESSLQGLAREGLLGILFAVLVIFVFLWSPRGTLIAAVSIPLSVALAFLVMAWQGLTLNIMTLAGLAVAVGRVVDDSIVVLENSYRHVQMGQAPAEAARSAAAEVAMPIAASTATTVAVFLPLGMIGGIIGQAFRPFAATVTFALLASLLVALTVVPVLCRLLLTRRHEETLPRERELAVGELLRQPQDAAVGDLQGIVHSRNGHRGEPWLLRCYTRLLRAVIAHPVAALLLAVATLGCSLALVPMIPTSFLPSEEEKLLMIEVSPPEGASRETTAAKAAEVEQLLSQMSDVLLYQTYIEDDTGALASMRSAVSGRGPGRAELLVQLSDEADLEAKLSELRASLVQIQGDSRITVASEQSMGTSRAQVVVSGQESVDVQRVAANVERELADVPGLTNVASDAARLAEEISIQVDPSRAAELGLTTAQLASTIRGMVAGQTVGRLHSGESTLDIRLSVPREAVENPEGLADLPFGAPKPVRLSEIAQIRREARPVQISRVAQSPAVSITGDIVAADAGAVSREIRRRIAAVELPAGVSVQYGGVMQQISEGFSSMAVGQLVGVALVYLVMAVFFNSMLDPLVILLSLPLAAVGALPALYLTGRPLSMSGMIGMLMLIGIVVTNAIVLVDFVRRARGDGRGLQEALLQAGRIRLRPILMTALTTILALAPLAFGLEKGSIIASELATVVMGGLISSTFLTLLVVPAAYSLVRR